MSAQEIVLKFIKCPSCKSLMPSTAVKCGMCGFELKTVEDEVASENLKKSRLRQRTTSLPGDFLSEQEETSEYSEHDQENSIDKNRPSTRSERAINPNIQDESNAQENEESRTENSVRYSPKDIIKDRENLNFRDKSEKSQTNIENDVESEDEFEEDYDDEQDVVSTESSHAQPSLDLRDESASPKKRKRRRKKKKRIQTENEQDVDLVKAEEENSPRNDKVAIDVVSEPSSAQRVGRSENWQQGEGKGTSQPPFEPSRPQFRETNVAPIDHVHESKVPDTGFIKEHSIDRSKFNEVTVNRASAPSKQNDVRLSDHSSRANISCGDSKKMERDLESAQLIGWFVNYSTNPSGVAFEIRLGKQFVGRQALRGDDLVISDSAVSTPHCLLQVERADSVFLQDLMSEHGTYVKKNGQRDFQKLESSINLEHGDRIKLGSYELVVCLVP